MHFSVHADSRGECGVSVHTKTAILTSLKGMIELCAERSGSHQLRCDLSILPVCPIALAAQFFNKPSVNASAFAVHGAEQQPFLFLTGRESRRELFAGDRGVFPPARILLEDFENSAI